LAVIKDHRSFLEEKLGRKPPFMQLTGNFSNLVAYYEKLKN
jgi:hypothetical protein